MQDDEKLFNIGLVMFIFVVVLTAFLQVCYRVQNNNLRDVRRNMEINRQEIASAEARFASLTAADSLRGSVVGVNPGAETVSFSKTVHIDTIPMVEE